jgi:hypothetical protein
MPDYALAVPKLSDVLASLPVQLHAKEDGALLSAVCKAADFRSPGHRRWCERFGLSPVWHRKQWEWCYIGRVLEQRGCLAPGKRGLGFAVGREPLAAAFAALGATVLATDAPRDVADVGGWTGSGQWAEEQAANNAHICPPDVFSARVQFGTLDMRQIPREHDYAFDFTWSACAFEHVGTAQAGLDFIVQQARCLKWGGVAVHTTEMRLFTDESIDLGGTILYSKSDLERLGAMLDAEGVRLVKFNWLLGAEIPDMFIDPASNEELHLRRWVGNCVTTSACVIAVRQTPPPG